MEANHTQDKNGWIPLTDLAMCTDWGKDHPCPHVDDEGYVDHTFDPHHHIQAIVSSNRYQMRLVIPERLGPWTTFKQACAEGTWYIRSVCGQMYTTPPGTPVQELPEDVKESLRAERYAVTWATANEVNRAAQSGHLGFTARETESGIHRMGFTFNTFVPSMTGWNGDDRDLGRIESWWLLAEIDSFFTEELGGCGVLAPLTRSITVPVDRVPLEPLVCIHAHRTSWKRAEE